MRHLEWRRGGDLNHRDPFESTRVPGVRLKPLGHLSAAVTQYAICPRAPASRVRRTPLQTQGIARTALRRLKSTSRESADTLGGAQRSQANESARCVEGIEEESRTSLGKALVELYDDSVRIL